MKYINIIILSIIISLVGILIYRWYFKNKEGFNNLSADDNLVKTTNISTHDYLWSNNLYLEQFKKSNELTNENLIVLQKPKLTGSSTGKILGSVITNKLDDLNKNTILVDKDVKKPVKLEKVFDYSDNTLTSEPILNKIMTLSDITQYKKRNDDILLALNASLDEYNDIFKKVLGSVNNQIDIKLFKDSLSEIGESKKFKFDENGNLIFKITNVDYNAISFPIGSSIKITTKSQETHNFNIAYGQSFDDNNLFNPFGKYGLGWKSKNVNNNQLNTNANRKFNYNYTIDSKSDTTTKNKLNTYLENFGNTIQQVNNDDTISYITIGNNKYFVNHIIEIDNNDVKYPIDAKRNIIRDIYVKGEKTQYNFRTNCVRRKNFKDSDIGRPSECNNNDEGLTGLLLYYDGDACVAGKNRGYCANVENTVLGDKYQNGAAIKKIYVNRKWISPEEFKNYETVKYNNNKSIPNFKIEIKYGSRENYNNVLTKKGITIKDINTDLLTDKLILSQDNLFNINVRNVLACLWHDGEVTLENYYSGTEQIAFEYTEEFNETNNQGPKYSPYVTIKFVNSIEAKKYVAHFINTYNAEFTTINNTVLTKKSINIDTITSTLSSKNNNIDQITENIKSVFKNYNSNLSGSSNIGVDMINTISNNITTKASKLKSDVELIYANLMMILPKFKIDKNGNIINSGYINLKNGKDGYLNNKISDIEITINKNSHPINQAVNMIVNDIKEEFKQFINLFEKDNEKYNFILNNVNENTLKHYPLVIHRPIAPTGYKALGDIVEVKGYTNNNSSSLYNKNPVENINEYGCVPEHCVIETRAWLNSDKIYEFNENGKYLALFRNPYLNTFRAVTTKNTTPEGAVEKVVACVAKSNIINNIKHADKCANEYKRNYEAVIINNNLDTDNILFDKQEAQFQNMLANRQDTIDNLRKTIDEVQKRDRQSMIINHSYNRKRFQDLLDKQIYNMDKLITNLYSVISINVNMDELITKLKARGITQAKIQEIIDTIKETDTTFTLDEGQIVPDTEEDVGETSDGNGPDAVIAEPAKLQRIIYRTRDGREQEMILRSLVESSCGCYFTDDEVIRTR